ncbi:cardiomyopathy-associated protein 5 [Stegastes partitus]|uniref:tRNA-uridine aminocarboxypropyltransferase n=2 Tax=Stegastes partitus TaxID=144197 RepID=A0A9Y4KC29_9TELE|nr:PREDICTED: DTW domain-containing protein 2 [Stegastes partitus]
MDAVMEDLVRSDVDAEMTVLTPEDITGQNLDAGDEVETLRNSLREAVHDDNVRPKMQCLMMDSSFSMVTMQGEDSGIAWETTPSRCTTPWASEAGNHTVDLSSPAAARPATPGSHPAGKIIFVMDEELMSRRKKTKERVSQKSKPILFESSENISGRPELVEVSQPNVKTEGEGDQEEPADPLEDKEQRLFRLVSEGSEILNIVVPPKLVTVDEEVSKEMVDNLSYLEESPVAKASEQTHDNELMISLGSDAAPGGPAKLTPAAGPRDPPGAPVPRPPGRAAPGNVDYFEAFNLVDAQAPGSPAVIAQGQEEPEAEAAAESQDTKKPVQSKDNTVTESVNTDKSDTVSLEEITSELLDEVFYGGTEDYMKSLDSASGGGAAGRAPSRLPSKPSGSNLFGSQEDILTPIFLPDGPPKIIDPILLEEPKAMAFLYTDLYEEAIGSRKKEEDTESMTSEKSFHSRHSDREARGYLEKYVLIDETPVVEAEPTDKEKRPQEGPRTLTQDLYDFGDFISKSEKGEVPNTEEEVTDFFRSSANSSPCDIEPFPRSLEEDDTQTTTKKKAKTEKSVSIKVEKAAEKSVDPLSISSFEFPSEEPEWGGTDEHPTGLDEKTVSVHTDQEGSDTNHPVAPPRKKVSTPKACLELAPLTPVDVITQEKEEEAGGKEQREEEKETASPAETADEGDGDGEETMAASSDVTPSENAAVKAGPSETQSVQDGNEKPAEEGDVKAKGEGRSEAETDTKQTDVKETDATEITAEEQGDTSTAVSTEPAKNNRQCIILYYKYDCEPDTLSQLRLCANSAMDNVPGVSPADPPGENGPDSCDSSSTDDGLVDAFGDLAALPVEVGERRPTCLRCRRPQKVCLCPFLPPQPLEVSTCLYVVQHPAEESRVLRTVPLLAACLPQGKCNVIVGRRFNEEKHPELAAVCHDSRTLILYPGPKSQNLEDLVQYQEVGTVKHNVIIIDGTWSQAKNMFLKNSLFHLPKQVQLNRTLSSQYVIRTQPSNICLSTLECAAVALSILERNDEIQEVLLRPLKALCSFQLQHGAQIHHSKEHLLRNGMYDKPMPKNKRKIKRMEKLITDHNICPR